MVDVTPHQKKKIAILGGGVGAMTAAFELTSFPGWQDQYEVTVYQQGWRLGGKGASGRNGDASDRIEEHGLHIWLGFYENAFGLMRRCYQELGRNPNLPLSSWDDAFKKFSYVGVMERLAQDQAGLPLEEMDPDWVFWIEYFKENNAVPGEGKEFLSIWDIVGEMLGLALHAFRTSPYGPPQGAPVPGANPDSPLSRMPPPEEGPPPLGSQSTSAGRKDSLLTDVATLSVGVVGSALGLLARSNGGSSGTGGAKHRMIVGPTTAYLQLLRAQELATVSDDHGHTICGILDEVRDWLWGEIEAIVEQNTVLRRLWILIDLVAAGLRGVVFDGVLTKGWQAIDDYDLREWLRKNGANDLTLDSGIVRGTYDFVFAYEKGDPRRPNIAAGSIVRAMLRMLFEYRGAIFWKMQAGMGDVVFGPLYIVLKSRGVKFEFFHKVTSLELDASKKKIARIRLDRQVYTKAATSKEGEVADCGVPSHEDAVSGDAPPPYSQMGPIQITEAPAPSPNPCTQPSSLPPLFPHEYYPLVPIKGLLSWPSKPLFDQIINGDALAAGWSVCNYNLESFWSAWKPVEKRVLELGEDFDVVVLGISLGALPFICQELIDHCPRWQKMVEKVSTVQTMSSQLWMRPSLQNLGWNGAGACIAAYHQPLNTYCDLTHLINRENWPVGTSENPNRDYPGSLAYLTGPLKDAKLIPEAQVTPFVALPKKPGDAAPESPSTVRADGVSMFVTTTYQPLITLPAMDAITEAALLREGLPPPTDHDFPRRMSMIGKQICIDWLRESAGVLWPLGTTANDPSELNWFFLVDPKHRDGEARFDAQYWRVNIDPSERYVMSPKGSTRYRIPSDKSGFENLFLAGDWTANGLDTGCVEAAAMSGMQASRGISGFPENIVGDYDVRGGSRKLDPVELVGDYDGAMLVIFLREDDVAAMLPHGLSLAPQDVAPPGYHPIVISLGARENTRFTFPRTLVDKSYKEVMTAVPFVRMHGVSLTKTTFMYVPRFYVSDMLMTGAGLLFWGLDTELSKVETRDKRSRPGERLWQVRSIPKSTPYLSATTRGHGPFRSMEDWMDRGDGGCAPMPKMLEVFTQRTNAINGNVAALRKILTQPMISGSVAGFGPFVSAYLDWGLGRCEIRPLDGKLTLFRDYIAGPPRGGIEVEGFDTAHCKSFGLQMRSRWKLSLPALPRTTRKYDQIEHDAPPPSLGRGS